MAAKSINMNFEQSQTIPREFVENNMIFLGLLIVQNKLKEKTKESLAKYAEADLRMLMATGDNILTGICLSKDCNLVSQNKEMISCEIENENRNEILKWKKLEDDEGQEVTNHENTRENPYNHDDSINPMMISKSQINLMEENSFLENTPNNIYELYPPENFNLNDSNKEKKHIPSITPPQSPFKNYT